MSANNKTLFDALQLCELISPRMEVSVIAQAAFLFTLLSCGEALAPVEDKGPVEAQANAVVDKFRGRRATEPVGPGVNHELVAELKARHEEAGKTPEGAFKVWLQAIYLIQDGDDDQGAAGWEMLTFLTLPYKESPGWEKKPAHSIFVNAVKGDKNIFRSYAEGATPENGYKRDPKSFSIVVTRTEDSDRGLKMFVKSGGADSPRPIYMKKSSKSGLYYVSDHVNTYVGVRPIVDPNKETFE
jgi:hypothetical protein